MTPWELGYGSFVKLAVDRESLVQVPGLPPATIGAWFRYRFATSVDCSPPEFAPSRPTLTLHSSKPALAARSASQ